MSTKPKSQQLAVKEAKLFKELLRDYEERNYKKALKTADTILKKSPENGETICMKGIVLHHSGKKQEGIELVKKGTRLDIGSHICWHVSALVWRAERDWEQALACYLQAVKCDRDQISIVRDLVALQLQLRHLPDTIEHRLHLLQAHPKLRTNWIGLAIAYHLNSQHKNALDILDKFEGMQVDLPKRDYDASETALYHALVLEEAGQLENAISYLNSKQSIITDRVGFALAKGRLSLATNQLKAAELVFRTMLNEHFENHLVIRNYLKSKECNLDDLSAENSSQIVAILDELHQNLPRSLAIRRLSLQFSTGDHFKKRLNTYLSEFISKGVPSLFVDIKPLYSDPEKSTIIEQVMLSFEKNLAEKGTLDGSDGDPDPPTSFVWTLYFLSQHYSVKGKDLQALEYINKVISHSPTLPDFYMIKARILKRGGDAMQAETVMEEARLLDGQDRFLNCKAAKYKIRIGKIEEAEKVAGLFTRKDAPSPLQDLTDMQCLWFLQEEGEAYRKQGKLGLALKRFHQIDKIFTDYREDEFDFHTWCLRKATLRAYISLVRFEDQLCSHPAYFKAAKGAIEIYLQLADKSQLNGVNGTHDTTAADEERRKAAKKAKKAEAKAKASGNESKKVASSTTIKVEEDTAPVVDEDPLGQQLAATDSPLEEALKFLRPLERMAGKRIDTWLLSFEVALKRRRFVEAIRALRQIHSMDASHPQLFSCQLRLHMLANQNPPVLSEAEAKLYKDVATTLFPFNSIDTFKSDFLQQHSTSARHILALAVVEPEQQKGDLLFQLLRPEVALDRLTAEEACALLAGSDRQAAFKQEAAQKFPLATAFRTESSAVQGSTANGHCEKEALDI